MRRWETWCSVPSLFHALDLDKTRLSIALALRPPCSKNSSFKVMFASTRYCVNCRNCLSQTSSPELTRLYVLMNPSPSASSSSGVAFDASPLKLKITDVWKYVMNLQSPTDSKLGRSKRSTTSPYAETTSTSLAPWSGTESTAQ